MSKRPYNIIAFALAASLLPANLLYADNSALSKSKTNLKQLETKINHLQQTLTQVHSQRNRLNQELAQAEKQISQTVQQLKKIQSDSQQKQDKINALQHDVSLLNQQLHDQQNRLAQHIRARYEMGEYQPLKWLLNQDKPNTMNRLLTYYQYLIKSNQQMMDRVILTKNTIVQKENNLKQEMNALNHLQQQMHQRQQQFDQEKRRRTTLMTSLDHDIQSKQQTLTSYQQNKANLTRLITSLAQQSVIQTRHPITHMRKKLIKPVTTPQQNIRKINQGIVFLAAEGTPVHAIYPGKVVFCDWLNGYGLLMIIDHGWGFMSLYANNQALFKHKGETVNQGEQIATVGHSGGIKQNGLYFEIRNRGKATPPLDWLQ